MQATFPRRVRAAAAATVCALATGVMTLAPAATTPAGALGGDNTVLTFGAAKFYGSTSGKALTQPIVGSAAAPSGKGYWLVASDGGIFSYGRARYHGSTGAMRLNQPIVGMAAQPKGGGYWLVARDGGVFTFGTARYRGSTGAKRLNSPILGMVAAPDGTGYWLYASDGGIFAFGSARFYGSTGSKKLNQPIVSMASTPGGHGYWLVARDGGIFAFGSARFYGSAGNRKLNAPIVGMLPTNDGNGYLLAGSDGAIFGYGHAPFFGSASGKVPSTRKVVAITGMPDSNGYRLLSLPSSDIPLSKPGDSGAGVLKLQQRLTGLGFWLGTPEGQYGALTQQAVYAFQKLRGLPRTGVVDLATQAALRNATRPKPRSTSGNLIEIDKPHQVMIFASNGRAQWIFNTSTGTEGPYTYGGVTYTAHTPEGFFHIIRQIDGIRVGRLGSLYRPKYFTNDGVALHGSPSIPPYPASHGCARLSNAAADFIWATNLAPIGTTVYVY